MNWQYKALWTDERGVLTFEWILLATVLILGVVAGVSAVRDALTDELADMADAVLHINQSFRVLPNPQLGTEGTQFVDQTGVLTRSGRRSAKGQGTAIDSGAP